MTISEQIQQKFIEQKANKIQRVMDLIEAEAASNEETQDECMDSFIMNAIESEFHVNDLTYDQKILLIVHHIDEDMMSESFSMEIFNY